MATTRERERKKSAHVLNNAGGPTEPVSHGYGRKPTWWIIPNIADKKLDVIDRGSKEWDERS